MLDIPIINSKWIVTVWRIFLVNGLISFCQEIGQLKAFTDLRWISKQLGVSPPGVEVCSVGLDILAAVGNAMGVEDKLSARDSK